MAGLDDLMSRYLGMAISGSLDVEQFRQWVMSRMLEFESMDDPDLLDLVFAIENRGYLLQDGSLSVDEFREELGRLGAMHYHSFSHS